MSAFAPSHVQQPTSASTTTRVAEFSDAPVWHVAAVETAPTVDLVAEAVAVADARAQELAALIEQFRGACVALTTLADELRRDAPPQLAEVAMFVAEQIVDTAIHTQSDVTLKCVQRLLEAERPVGTAELEINSADHALLTTNVGAAFTALTTQAGVTIKTSDSLPRGVCRLITEKFHLEENLPRRVAAVWREVQAAHGQTNALPADAPPADVAEPTTPTT